LLKKGQTSNVSKKKLDEKLLHEKQAVRKMLVELTTGRFLKRRMNSLIEPSSFVFTT
jgi:hypothetical protein